MFDLSRKGMTTKKTVMLGLGFKMGVKKTIINKQCKKNFINLINPFFKNLKFEQLIKHQAGIRAKIKEHFDFVIKKKRKISKSN